MVFYHPENFCVVNKVHSSMISDVMLENKIDLGEVVCMCNSVPVILS